MDNPNTISYADDWKEAYNPVYKEEKTDTIQVIAPEYYDAPIQQSVDTTSTEGLTLY